MNDINKLLQGKYDTSQEIKLRDHTPKLLVDYGIKDLPILMNSNHVLSNILTKNEAKDMNNYKKDFNYHGLGVKKFIEVINDLDNPIAIYENTNKKDYIIITDRTNNNNETIIAVLYIKTKGNYNKVEIKTNKIKSIYGKNNLKEYILKKIKSNTLKEIYNKKTK